MIRETKGTLDESKLRPIERAKVRSARQHFKALEIDDYALAAPGNWNL